MYTSYLDKIWYTYIKAMGTETEKKKEREKKNTRIEITYLGNVIFIIRIMWPNFFFSKIHANLHWNYKIIGVCICIKLVRVCITEVAFHWNVTKLFTNYVELIGLLIWLKWFDFLSETNEWSSKVQQLCFLFALVLRHGFDLHAFMTYACIIT